MKRTEPRRRGRPALDMIEEATQRVRTAPVGTLAVYFLGGVPFVVGLLFFWTDMSRSPFAAGHLAEGSLGVAGLFLWMKFWHVVFARRMRAHVTGEKLAPLGFRQGLRILVTQTICQPSSLFLLPLALIPLLPFAWVYSFYQNVTVLDDGEPSSVTGLWKKSARQASLWGMQNQIILLLLAFFAFCVFLNWMAACLALPELARMLFGFQSDWTRSHQSLLNSTFLAAMWGLTYLSVDPILKTVYLLRCFYGQSLESGEDLKTELKPYVQTAARMIVLLLLSAASLLPWSVRADGTNEPVAKMAAPAISPSDLDRTINQTIHERKYIWRMPREKVADADEQQGILARFFTKMQEMVSGWLHDFWVWVRDLLRKWFHHRTPPVTRASSGGGWIEMLYVLFYCLIGVVVLALVLIIIRLWQERRKIPAVVASAPIQPAPDITDENVGADQLPEDGWTKLARELLDRGEFRLAMRAFYLACLAHLAGRNLVNIARFKSNRDYERELRRRAHAFPALVSLFGENLSNFERIWYGMHEVNGDVVGQFAANVEKIKAGG